VGVGSGTKGGLAEGRAGSMAKTALIAIAGLMLLGTCLYVLQGPPSERKRAEALLRQRHRSAERWFLSCFDAQGSAVA